MTESSTEHTLNADPHSLNVGACGLCGGRLDNADAYMCNNCWETDTRVRNNTAVAIKVLELLGYTVTRT